MQAQPDPNIRPAPGARSAIEIGLRSRIVRIVLILSAIGLGMFITERVFALGQQFQGILSTLAAAWLLSMLASPIIRFFQIQAARLYHALRVALEDRSEVVRRSRREFRLPFGVAVAMAYLVMLVILLGLFVLAAATIIPQVPDFFARLPEIAASLPSQVQALVTDFLARFGVRLGDLPLLPSPSETSTQLRQFAALVAGQALLLVTSTAGFVGQLLFALILSVYMTFEGRVVGQQFFEVMPRSTHASISAFLTAIGRAFSGYLTSMVVSALIQGLITVGLFALFGVPFGFVVGIVFGLLTFIPLIGAPLGVIIAAAVALFFKPEAALPIAVILFIVNQIFAYAILPRMLSNTVGVPGLVQLIAVAIGTQLLGFWGLVFSVPFMGAVYAVVFHFYLPRRRVAQAEISSERTLFEVETEPGSAPPATMPPEFVPSGPATRQST